MICFSRLSVVNTGRRVVGRAPGARGLLIRHTFNRTHTAVTVKVLEW